MQECVFLVSYNSSGYLEERHGLPAKLSPNLAVVEAWRRSWGRCRRGSPKLWPNLAVVEALAVKAAE
jgi:hypothetical protein